MNVNHDVTDQTSVLENSLGWRQRRNSGQDEGEKPVQIFHLFPIMQQITPELWDRVRTRIWEDSDQEYSEGPC